MNKTLEVLSIIWMLKLGQNKSYNESSGGNLRVGAQDLTCNIYHVTFFTQLIWNDIESYIEII